MQKRRVILGDYDTAAHGWTLTGVDLSAAEMKTNYFDKPSGDGSWDLSTALTDGVARYKDRNLTITLECSEGTRQEREEEIRGMVNQLDGIRDQVRLPDDDHHYMIGRLHVVKKYNDLAHAAVTVTAVCEPWKYAIAETIVSASASFAKQTMWLVNSGRKVIAPTLTVTGSQASVLLQYGTASISLSAGTYQWPELVLSKGTHEVIVSGSGVLTVTYREAVLE